MQLHQSSGRWQLGLILALTTSILWGFLAVALQIVLQVLDANTVTWFRFLGAFGLLVAYLVATRQFPDLRKLSPSAWGLLALATLGLAANYILFVMGLEKTSPSNAQVIIQLAPVLMGLTSLGIFKERYTLGQWLGLGILICGLTVFAHGQLTAPESPDGYLLGNFLLVLAAIAWVVYGIAQKQLLQVLPSPAIMMVIYGGSALLFAPSAQLNQILDLAPLPLGLLIFCALNTLVAYGAFAEALAHWEASRVSAVLALTPLITIAVAVIAPVFLPVAPAMLSSLALGGAVLVVLGSLAISLSSQTSATTR